MPVKGLLLLNLGSPQSPTRRDVKTYLDEFLMDPYVIDIPAVFRYPLVRGLITPFRAAKSAEAYQKIWTKNGSPLVYFTKTFAEKVRHELKGEWDVRWAMRYGQPSIKDTLKDWAVDELYIVALYPQYAESSTRSALEAAIQAARKMQMKAKIYLLQDFHVAPEFITAQAKQIVAQMQSFRPDHLLLSFHGLPEHHMTKLHPTHCLENGACCEKVTASNRLCYRAQSIATAHALTRQLTFAADKISVSFQSRLGRRPWIRPYTDHVIEELAAKGKKRVLVSCPSFVADCLETLEEIEIRLKEQFIQAGGEALALVPAVNNEDHWSKGFAAMIRRPDLEWSTQL